MDRIHEARQLKDGGHFRDALASLDKCSIESKDRWSVIALRAELLERLGQSDEATVLIQRALSSKSLTLSDRSLCQFVLARIAMERGAIETAILHLNKSIADATRATDFERLCQAQLKLLVILSDDAGTDATGPLLAEVRGNAARSGNPTTLAAVHVYCAQIEATRSSIRNSRRHIRLALQLLRDTPNIWLETVIENIELALSIMASEFGAAEAHARRGLELAERCGGAIEFAVNQGNSGFLWQVLGRLDEAVNCYERAMRLFANGSENYRGAVDSLARVRLAQGRIDECEGLLALIDDSIHSRKDRATYVFRHVQLTRGQVCLRRGDPSGAANYFERTRQLALEAGDSLLLSLALLAKAELLATQRRFSEVALILDEFMPRAFDQSAEVSARCQRMLGLVAAMRDLPFVAKSHYARAERIYLGLHHQEGLQELRSCRSSVQEEHAAISANSERDHARSILHSIVTVLEHSRHPELMARELVLIFDSIGLCRAVRAVSISDSAYKVIANSGEVQSTTSATPSRRIQLGETNNGRVEIIADLNENPETISSFYAVAALVSKAIELRDFRAERDERAPIWPVEELPCAETNAVISGHLRELITLAQRVARTTVNVLITGDSGTGKEIVARAIHDFSDRALKPFVTFNCAAVPRELLESQLFGHRRGAFTGAERDQLGLIRAAADGTLFLDEVGDLSLDLQPKLLRFLESGEIAPLGEPSPLHVNVRIVAATNAKLEDAVREGRFREDLFYRLNVVRLTIKPLRERRDEIPGLVNHFVANAAQEYKKGHLQVAEETMERLLLYRWPGNVRQLQNEIRRMVALAEPNSTLEPESISPEILGAMPDLRRLNGREIAISLHDKLLPTLSRIEYEMIKAALAEHHGKVEVAAKSLGISRKGLYLKRQRLGL